MYALFVYYLCSMFCQHCGLQLMSGWSCMNCKGKRFCETCGIEMQEKWGCPRMCELKRVWEEYLDNKNPNRLKVKEFLRFFHEETWNIYYEVGDHNSDRKITLEKDKDSFSQGLCFVLFLLWIVPGIIYMLTTYGKKYRITIFFDEKWDPIRIQWANFSSIISEYKSLI